MSSSDERNVRSPAANNVQQRACSRSSHEHHQAPMQRDDGTAATREVVPEGSIGAGNTGSPSPRGGQQNQPIYVAEKNIWNKRQQAPRAASRSANPGASIAGPQQCRGQAGRSQRPGKPKSRAPSSLVQEESPATTLRKQHTGQCM